VGSHLEGRALALVVDRALLDILVRYGIGLHGIELEVRRGGVKVGRSYVEAVQHLFQIVGCKYCLTRQQN